MSSQDLPEETSRTSAVITLFKTGDTVISSGLYAVVRSAHQLPRAVFLATGQKFPGCSLCTESVQFWLLQHVQTPTGVDLTLRTLPAHDNSSAEPAIE